MSFIAFNGYHGIMRRALILLMIVPVLITINAGDSLGCKVCHSKNPKMVIMHEKPENKACFSCHGKGQINSKEKLPEQMVTDMLCAGCHLK